MIATDRLNPPCIAAARNIKLNDSKGPIPLKNSV